MKPPPAGRLICLGDVMLDVLAQLPGPLATGSDTPAPITFSPGGSAANTAAWLGWLGTPVTFVGRIGDDAFGAEAVASLRRLGVLTAVTIDFERPTGVCLVLVSPDGERTMVPSAGANSGLAADDVLTSVTAEDHLHLSGYSLLNPESRPAALAALAAAGSCSVDAASAAPIRAAGAEQFLQWLPAGALVLANADELAALGGDPAALVRRGLTLVVKDGAAGARLADRDGIRTVATAAVPVRDSTGAGDAFAAGLLAAWWSGTTLLDAVAAGNAAGARALATVGGRPA
ncbi:MAG TPA: carbohydrate kinase family protein [Jatrophihabitans sp.]|nr:carbohydrate kinase family protein [Jatrophihabitans sp.]